MVIKNLKDKTQLPEEKNIKRTYLIFIWHGAFLGLTVSMLDFSTIFPALISNLTESKIIFGLLFSVMLGTPLIFNIILSSFMHVHRYKKKILLLGIYLRVFHFWEWQFLPGFLENNFPSL